MNIFTHITPDARARFLGARLFARSRPQPHHSIGSFWVKGGYLVLAVLAFGSCSQKTQTPIPDLSDLSELGVESIVPSEYDRSQDPRYLVLKGEHLGRQGRTQESLALFQRAAKLTADIGVIQRALEIALYIFEYQAALELSDFWIQVEPDSFLAHLSHLSNLLLLNRLEESTAQLERLLLAFVHDGKHYIQLSRRLLNPTSIDVANLDRVVRGVSESARHRWWSVLAAEVAINLENFEFAEKRILEVMDKGMNHEVVFNIRARIYFLQKQNPEALRFLEKTLKSHTDYFTLYMMRARWRVSTVNDQRHSKESKRALTLAIEDVEFIRDHHAKSGKDDVDVYVNATHLLAFIYRLLEREDELEPILLELSTYDQYTEFAYLSLAQIELGRKNYLQAESYLRRVQSYEYRKEALEIYLLVKTGLKQWREAFELVNYFRVHKPSGFTKMETILYEGHILMKMNKYRRAYDLFTQALEEFPESVKLLRDRSLAAFYLEWIDEVERDLRAILKDDPNNALLLNQLGYALIILTTRYDEAEELLDRALKLKPEDPAILDSYGWLLFKKAEHDRALYYLNQAWDQSKRRDGTIAAHIIEVLWVTGEKQKAKTMWNEVKLEFPDNSELIETIERLGISD